VKEKWTRKGAGGSDGGSLGGEREPPLGLWRGHGRGGPRAEEAGLLSRLRNGAERRHEFLDLARALSPGFPYQHLVILGLEMGRQERDSRERELPCLDRLQKQREVGRSSSRVDAPGRFAFCVAQRPDAVIEERCVTAPPRDAAFIHLRKMLQDRDEVHSLVPAETVQ
jgi:hypothetical protein